MRLQNEENTACLSLTPALGTEIGAILERRRFEVMLKEGQSAEALAGFERLFAANPDTVNAAGVCRSLRALGRFDDALRFIDARLSETPDDNQLKREKYWLLFEGGFKVAKKAEDLELLLAYAETLLTLDDSPRSVNIIALSVFSLARSRARHDIVLDWTNRVIPSTLSTKPRSVDGRKIPSDRERFACHAVQCRLALGLSEEARQISLETVRLFPRSVDFSRWAALALAAAGKTAEAVVELIPLAEQARNRWYIRADLARLQLESGDIEAAWQSATKAAAGPGETKLKVNLYALLANIAITRNDIQAAVSHVELAWAIREREGWSVPGGLLELATSCGVVKPGDLDAALAKSRSCWVADSHCDNSSMREGIVKVLLAGHGNAFITPVDGGKDVFVQANDLPLDCREVGTRIRFISVTSFDTARQRESERAVRVIRADLPESKAA
ncbi:MAG: tetratricopeptide repeat protein [Candidatus Riflebacteria bacterium]|nr:tetratricopeptide repeat protein [Candidatus Riflebacteria bacterium]